MAALPPPVTLEASAADQGKRLDQFVHDRLPAYSRSRIQDWIRRQRVLVNGVARKPSFALLGGERVEVSPAPPPPLDAYAEAIPLELLYEDEDLVAVNKPAGMVVHAGAGRHSGTLVNALLHRFPSLSGLGGAGRPGIVHRLDRDTSGVILVARNDRAHRNLAAQFAGRKVRKEYLTLVHGDVRPETGRIESPIARDPRHRTRMTARLGIGRHAESEYRALGRFPGFTLLEVRIATGRTHQIRVHLASIGHPVAGDRTYGAPVGIAGQAPLGRFFLHARRVAFLHPRTGEPLEIEAPLAPELESWLAGL
jgi:23S rRNA pseudouridine1911/1915/1917 synthase